MALRHCDTPVVSFLFLWGMHGCNLASYTRVLKLTSILLFRIIFSVLMGQFPPLLADPPFSLTSIKAKAVMLLLKDPEWRYNQSIPLWRMSNLGQVCCFLIVGFKVEMELGEPGGKDSDYVL